jgi:hypothetical protein
MFSFSCVDLFFIFLVYSVAINIIVFFSNNIDKSFLIKKLLLNLLNKKSLLIFIFLDGIKRHIYRG